MKRFLTTATVAALVLQPLAAFAGCTVYEHENMGGASWYLDAGEILLGISEELYGCTNNGHGDPCVIVQYTEPSWNDVVSSYEVDSGCRITMYEHVEKGGARWRSWDSYDYVGDDWNDVASEVSCYCE